MSIQVTNVSTVNNSNCKNTPCSAITVKNYLEPEMIKRLERTFNDKESYINLMAGLWRAREGGKYAFRRKQSSKSNYQ